MVGSRRRGGENEYAGGECLGGWMRREEVGREVVLLSWRRAV